MECYSLSTVVEGFTGYSSVSWNLHSRTACRRFMWALLAFRFSIKNLGIVLIDLPLYIIWSSPLAAFNSLSFFFTCHCYMPCGITFLLQLIWCSVFFLYFDTYHLFGFGKFSSTILLKIFYVPLTCVSSPFSVHIISRFDFFIVS